MIARGGGLIANISSSGAAEYAWHVVYGVGKAALDRITADTAHELAKHSVSVISLGPGLVKTERTLQGAGSLPGLDLTTAESSRFTGRAIAALAADPHRINKTGRAIPSRDLADEYGFTDLDGTLPAGPLHNRS
jgi:NAD(P)-dependent dehydrogenase (short-subunit alcohol dehydrogenase family)